MNNPLATSFLVGIALVCSAATAPQADGGTGPASSAVSKLTIVSPQFGASVRTPKVEVRLQVPPTPRHELRLQLNGREITRHFRFGPYKNGRREAWIKLSPADGLKDGILTMAPYTNMPDDVKDMAMKTEAGIKDGSIHPFTGPVKKQDGSEWLAAGQVSDDGTLLGMNFYVEGVDDKLPQ